MNKASTRSKKKLEGVDSRLVLMVGYALAISPVDFFVNEGVRSEKNKRSTISREKVNVMG